MAGTPPAVRAFDMTVVATARVGASFVRVTLRADGPRPGLAGDDQRVGLVLAAPDGTSRVADGEDLYEAWRAMPDVSRPVLRTYTVRRSRAEIGEVDVDVVIHDDETHAGPASSWAVGVEPGATVQLVAPDRDGRGREWGTEWDPPDDAELLVLAGDESALPAIAAILERADRAGPPLLALVEVPHDGDRVCPSGPERAQVRWGVRGGRPHGACLEELVRAALPSRAGGRSAGPGGGAAPQGPPDHEDVDALLWDVAGPGGGGGSTYVWVAGEAGALRPIRRYLRRDLAMPRSATSVMGYWRQGVASG